ncbi:MAG: hypothetical protein K2N72_14415 [Oscillospiraceae bacterium]|nr:hypothetical protein [Oscillospiraceae bacterium]
MDGFRARKRAGKIFAVFTALVLMCGAAVYWYVGGQTRTAEKFFSAVASGNYKNYEQTMARQGYEESSRSIETDFKDGCRGYFTSLPQFSDMSETDIISSKIRIKERAVDGNITKWRLTVDADFFSSGKSVSYDGLVVSMEFDGGKWRIGKIENNLYGVIAGLGPEADKNDSIE